MSEIERAIDDFNNYVEMGYGQYFRPSSESTELALTALKEKLEREKNKPMTIDELSEMGGKPYWHVSLDGNGSYWNILDGWVATIPNDYHYGERWLAYRYEPKGEKA